jgi:outer membrane protein assembly factor BamA
MSHFIRAFTLRLSLLVAAASQGFAQTNSPYTIHKLVFQGKTPYSQATLESASGLKVGAMMTQADLQAAAERLIATGAFADVGAELDGPVKSITVIFKVQATGPEHIVQASFDNFVWLSHDELIDGLKARVPLFNGTIPEGGNVQDAVQDALKAMLVAKGVEVKVSSQLVAPRPGQPFRMAEYHVVTPSVRVHLLDVAGVPAGFAPATDKVVHGLMGGLYNDGLVGGLSERILLAYRNAGYQESTLAVVTTIAAASPSSATPARVDVDVAATLHPGAVYRVSKVEWAGSPMMSEEAFEGEVKLHPGDVASQQKLEESLEFLDAAYRNQGYLDVVLDAAPKLDTAAHQVAFTVTAIPGTQYKLREVNVQGLTAAQRQEFDSAWKLHAGDLYSAGYVKNFLANNTALQTLTGMSASFKVTQDPEAGVADLNVTFFKGGTR